MDSFSPNLDIFPLLALCCSTYYFMVLLLQHGHLAAFLWHPRLWLLQERKQVSCYCGSQFTDFALLSTWLECSVHVLCCCAMYSPTHMHSYGWLHFNSHHCPSRYVGTRALFRRHSFVSALMQFPPLTVHIFYSSAVSLFSLPFLCVFIGAFLQKQFHRLLLLTLVPRD